VNPIVRNTWRLLAGLIGLLAVDLWVHHQATADQAPLPAIPKVDPLTVHRISLTEGDTLVVLERQTADDWQITAPFAYPADHASVQGILGALREGVPMDVQVDREDFETYGLQSPDAILVEVAGEAGALATFYVGANAAGGSTFVRFPDADAIYRARIGGRHRFDRLPGEWRDHMVLRFDPSILDGITLERDDGTTLQLARSAAGLDAQGGAHLGPWRFDGDPDFPVDQQTVEAVATGLSQLRAGEILSADHPAGLDAPTLTATLRFATDEHQVLVFGRTPDGVYIRREGAPEVFHIAPSVLDRLMLPRPAWRERQFVLADRAQMHRLSLVEPGLTTVLEQDPATSSWTVITPANVDADLRESMFAARALADLRADELAAVTPTVAGFPSQTLLIVTLLDGRTLTVEIGAPVPGRPPGREAVYVRTPGEPDRIGMLSAVTLSRIRKAFAR
jgi:hypothetical protein